MAEPEILPNDFSRQWNVVGHAVLTATERVGASGRYILGGEVEGLEKALAERCGLRHAVGVGNGMDALEIALRSLGLKAGERVLTTPLSAFATTLAIVRAGGVPMFVDVDDLGALDLRQCRAALEQDRTIRFLLPVHLFGVPLHLGELQQLRDDFGLRVVEDCAQAIGAAHDARSVGSVGQMAATSFYPTKNLGALGDGGAVLTNDEELARRAKALRNYGQSALYSHDEIGLNSRLDELQAAILHDALLPHLSTWLNARAATARAYLDGIRNPSIRLLDPAGAAKPAWHLFPVLIAPSHREAFREHLSDAGIKTGVHYPRLIPEQQALRGMPKLRACSELVNARRFADGEVSLPIHPFLTGEEVERVIDACNGWRP